MLYVYKNHYIFFALASYAVIGFSKELNVESVHVIKNTIQIKINGHVQQYKSTHSIEGYSINCQKTYLSTWGRALVLNPDSPQDSFLSVVDLKRKKIKQVYNSSKGIFDVIYLNNGIEAFVDSGLPALVNLRRFRYASSLSLVAPSLDSIESCNDFEYKSFRSYKK